MDAKLELEVHSLIDDVSNSLREYRIGSPLRVQERLLRSKILKLRDEGEAGRSMYPRERAIDEQHMGGRAVKTYDRHFGQESSEIESTVQFEKCKITEATVRSLRQDLTLNNKLLALA